MKQTACLRRLIFVHHRIGSQSGSRRNKAAYGKKPGPDIDPPQQALILARPASQLFHSTAGRSASLARQTCSLSTWSPCVAFAFTFAFTVTRSLVCFSYLPWALFWPSPLPRQPVLAPDCLPPSLLPLVPPTTTQAPLACRTRPVSRRDTLSPSPALCCSFAGCTRCCHPPAARPSLPVHPPIP